MAKELYTTGLLNDANLQGYWRLEANGTDETANNNDLSAVGGFSTYPQSVFGKGGDFNGSSTALTITDANQTNLDITGSFSISAWINLDEVPSVTGTGMAIAGKLDTADGYRLLVNTSDQIRVVIRSDPDVTTADSTGTVVKDTWYHVVGVYDTAANTIVTYINGVGNTTGSATVDPADHAEEFCIGVTHSGGSYSQWLDGTVDDVAVFDRALTAAEVLNLYRGGRRVSALV